MTKYALMIAAAGFVAFAPAIVKAEESHTTTTTTHTETSATVKHAELADGTKVSIEGHSVFVVAADGTKTAAPDGDHKLKDGTTVTVKDGMLVK